MKNTSGAKGAAGRGPQEQQGHRRSAPAARAARRSRARSPRRRPRTARTTPPARRRPRASASTPPAAAAATGAARRLGQSPRRGAAAGAPSQAEVGRRQRDRHRPQLGARGAAREASPRRRSTSPRASRWTTASKEILSLATRRGIPVLEVMRPELDRLAGPDAVHQGVALKVPPYEYAHPIDLLDADHQARPEAAVRRPRRHHRPAQPRRDHPLGRGVRRPGRHRAAASLGRPDRLGVEDVGRCRRAHPRRDGVEPDPDAQGVQGARASSCSASTAAATSRCPASTLADRPLVIVVGSEGKGLSRLVTETCDAIVSIPITRADRVAERRHRRERHALRDLEAARRALRVAEGDPLQEARCRSVRHRASGASGVVRPGARVRPWRASRPRRPRRTVGARGG